MVAKGNREVVWLECGRVLFEEIHDQTSVDEADFLGCSSYDVSIAF